MRRVAPVFALVLFAAVGRGQSPSTDRAETVGMPAHATAGTSVIADCDPAAPACAPRWWARGEPLFWAIGDRKLVDLGLSAIDSSTYNGLLTLTGKSNLDVVERLLGDDRTGYRLGLGGWLDDDRVLGVESDFLYVSRAPLTFQLGRNVDLNPLARLIPNGDIVLQRAGFLADHTTPDDQRKLATLLLLQRRNPILRTLFLLSRLGLPGIDPGGREFVIPYGSRDLVNGSAVFSLADQSLWAFDLLGKVRLAQGDGLTVDGLVGYRRVSYSDGLKILTDATTVSRPLLPGTSIRSLDAIGTSNTYDGVLVGADVGWRSGSWELSLRATATPAEYEADVNRLGAKTISFPDSRPRLTVAGGTYLRAGEVGNSSTWGWTVLSEVGLRATRTFGDHFALTLGGSLMYIPDAAVAYPQLPLGQDPDRGLAGRSGTVAVRPLPPALTAIFLSTLSAGLEFRY